MAKIDISFYFYLDGCMEYKTDSRWQRSISNNVSEGFCDGSLEFSWYRFISNAGPDMPTECPNENSCGWLSSFNTNSSNINVYLSHLILRSPPSPAEKLRNE